ncbi:hypothetical protein L211DRAFT_854174 [Terfezia boudieri ATCC MYA-4762]|uniref:Uncharacterized protein n=1 Tax=Terfezia boudieri ATCC MYA-4762 TaxID=1051890 RepID=A0A3N4L651_9PEZI|nr:hypothetical protein L211DRAFT_854174 [Terfezia boudieri ATCC MYA-4762]
MDLCNLVQENKTNKKYAQHTQEIYTILSMGFGLALVNKFIWGIADEVTRKVVNSQLDEKFGIDHVWKVFLKTTREEREIQASRKVKEKERKGGFKEPGTIQMGAGQRTIQQQQSVVYGGQRGVQQSQLAQNASGTDTTRSLGNQITCFNYQVQANMEAAAVRRGIVNPLLMIVPVSTVEMEEVYPKEYDEEDSVELEMMVNANMVEVFEVMMRIS